MDRELLLAGAPFLALGLNAAAQTLLFRLHPRLGLLRSEYAGFAAGLAALVGALAALLAGSPARAGHEGWALGLLSLLTYAALGYGYFHFVNLGETARRIRILRELAEGGGLTRAQLRARYGAGEIVDRRLSRLLGTGQIVLRGDRLFIAGPVVLAIAAAMVALKRLLLGKGSEYDA